MKTRKMVLCAFLAAITIICSLISLPIGISAVPFSLGIVGIFLAGTLLEPVPAALSQLIYLALGIAGLPVFSQFQGGFGVFTGPTGGYLFAYPVMALVISLILKKIQKRRFPFILLSYLPAIGICYVSGSLWLSFVTGIPVAAGFMTGAVPFIIPDIIKAVLSALLSVAVIRPLSKIYPGYLK